jgi:hypothetical protein
MSDVLPPRSLVARSLVAVSVVIGIVPIVGGLVVYRLSRRAHRMAAA